MMFRAVRAICLITRPSPNVSILVLKQVLIIGTLIAVGAASAQFLKARSTFAVSRLVENSSEISGTIYELFSIKSDVILDDFFNLLLND